MTKPAAKRKPEAAAVDAPIGKTRRAAPREVDSRKLQDPQARTARIALEGPAKITVDDIEMASDGPGFEDVAEALAFAEETVIITIHPSSEKFPVDPISVGVNGRMCYIPRGVECIVKRKYVERLMRAKPNTITQDVTNKDPDIVNRLNITSGLLYPFSLVEDKNPKGGSAWMRKIMAEA